jgi:hypothetical protein
LNLRSMGRRSSGVETRIAHAKSAKVAEIFYSRKGR